MMRELNGGSTEPLSEENRFTDQSFTKREKLMLPLLGSWQPTTDEVGRPRID
jgi:hypothetical protein